MAPVMTARFHMPAEWAPHRSVWTAWPHDREQWAEGLEAPQRALMAMLAAIVDDGRGERVELLVRGAADEAAARTLLGAAANHVSFHAMAYGDVWLRDTGPIFVARDSEIAAAHFAFDGWGGKYVMAGDAEVAANVVAATGVCSAVFDFVLEGGAIEVDGTGNLLTTKQCLLHGQRNPGLDSAALEARLRWALGVEQIVWLDRGLANDHTDGHIDTLARFVAPGVIACMEPIAGDPNRDALNAIVEDLRRARSATGSRFEVVTVPSPGPVYDAAGNLLPASYMNFYIANTVVVVPTYNSPADERAVRGIAEMFPSRRVIALPCKDVVVGGGGFHCTTQQQPSP